MSFIQDPRNKLALYFLSGIGFYLFAMFLGFLGRLLFGLEYVTVNSKQVDLVTYIVIGAVELLLEIIMILVSGVMIAIVWIYNGFFVDIIFKLPLINTLFGGITHFPESSVQEIVNGISLLKDMVVGGSVEILTFVPEVIDDIADDIVDLFTGSERRE